MSGGIGGDEQYGLIGLGGGLSGEGFGLCGVGGGSGLVEELCTSDEVSLGLGGVSGSVGSELGVVLLGDFVHPEVHEGRDQKEGHLD